MPAKLFVAKAISSPIPMVVVFTLMNAPIYSGPPSTNITEAKGSDSVLIPIG